MIEALHHIALIASSETSLPFYELLGFHETLRIKRERDTVVLMEGYGIRLEVFIDPRHPLHKDREEPYGLLHFGLKVNRLEDEMERLKAAAEWKVEFSPIMTDWTGIRFFNILSPDGVKFELHE